MATLFEHHRPIFVGIDGSSAALAAVRWAAREASARRLPLTLVHLQPDPGGRYHDEKAAEAMRPALREQAEKWLHEAVTAARTAAPGLNPSVELRDAEVVPGLVEMSAGAAMIVLGARGIGGFTGMLVGTTAISVVAGASCPVAVIRTPQLGRPKTTGPVVVGVDGAPAGEAAIKFAFESAALRGSPVIAVHTWTEVFLDPELNVDRIAFDTTVLAEREQELLAQRLAGWQEKYPDVPVTRVVTQGRPVRVLLDYDDEAQLIVVGSRGLGGCHGMLLGSTSQALIHYTRTPLAVVR